MVILPFESHGYAARESIMHVLWESDRWLQKYCVLNTFDANVNSDSSKDVAKESTDSESKAIPAGGGVKELDHLESDTFQSIRRSSLW